MCHGASLRDLIVQKLGLKLWLGVDVHYCHMFQKRISLGHLSIHTAVLDNDFQIDQVLYRLGEEVLFRNANFLRNSSPILFNSVSTARYAPRQGDTFRERLQFLVIEMCVFNVENEDNRCFEYSIISSCVHLAGSLNRATAY